MSTRTPSPDLETTDDSRHVEDGRPAGPRSTRPGRWRRASARATRVAVDDTDRAEDGEAGGAGGPDAPVAGPPARPRRVVRPPRRWPWVLGILLVVGALVGGFVVLWWTPALGLRAVQVSGVPAELRDEVVAAVDVPIGTPLARIDLDAVSGRVADVPEVASVQVNRGWPDSLDVQVVARTPVAVTQANGSWWLMDAGGDPYVTVPGAPAGLPVVELATPGRADPATAAALTVAQALPESLRSQVAAVAARTGFDVTLRLTDGRTVVWGDAADAVATARKIQVLPALLRQDGTVYDVSDPTLVTVR